MEDCQDPNFARLFISSALMFASNLSLLIPFIFRASESFTFFIAMLNTEFTGALISCAQKNVVLGLKLFAQHQLVSVGLC